jgi:hypothetical protein
MKSLKQIISEKLSLSNLLRNLNTTVDEFKAYVWGEKYDLLDKTQQKKFFDWEYRVRQNSTFSPEYTFNYTANIFITFGDKKARLHYNHSYDDREGKDKITFENDFNDNIGLTEDQLVNIIKETYKEYLGKAICDVSSVVSNVIEELKKKLKIK